MELLEYLCSYHRRMVLANEVLLSLPRIDPSTPSTLNNKIVSLQLSSKGVMPLTELSLPSPPPPPSPLDSPLYIKLRARINDYFVRTQQSSRGGMYGKSILLVLLTIVVWWMAV